MHWLIDHQLKSKVRSSFWQKNLILNLIIGFFIFIIALYVLALGFFIDGVIMELYPNADVFTVFCGFLFYYLLIDLSLRFFLVGLPKVNVASYLHLPIKKSKIIRLVLGRSMLNVMNFLPFLVFIPFAIQNVVPKYSALGALFWLFAIFVMLLNNSFFIHWLKRKFFDKPLMGFLLFSVLVVIVGLENLGVVSSTGVSQSFFLFLMENKIAVLVLLLVLVLNLGLNYNYLKSILNIEGMQSSKAKKYSSFASKNYFESFGDLGEMMMLELRLIFRNKRSRTLLMMFPLFVLYGLIFYNDPENLDRFGMLIFVGAFMTGGLMLNYAQYIFGWESAYFDFILTRKISAYKHILAKYYCAILLVFIPYLMTIPYVYFGPKVLIINTAICLFNMGVMTLLTFYFATYSKNRIEMSTGSSFNYQGMSAMNWLITLPFFFLGIIIYIPFAILNISYWGIGTIGFLGLLALVLHRQILKLIVAKFHTRRYVMAKGFREKE